MVGMKKRARHLLIRKKVEKEMEEAGLAGYIAMQIGKRKEMLVMKVLEELKEVGTIRDFVPSGNRSYSDMEGGIDVFATRVGEKGYQVIPLSITGRKWVEKHKNKHPEVPVIEVNSWESYSTIKKRVTDVIEQYK